MPETELFKQGSLIQIEALNQISKTTVSKKTKQKIHLPIGLQGLSINDRVLLKTRFKSRSVFCFADVLSNDNESIELSLDQKYQIMHRSNFFRHNVSVPGRLNREEVLIYDISVAGAGIKAKTDSLNVGAWYPFQLGHFSSKALVRSIDDGWLNVQFLLKDSLHPTLISIVTQARRANTKRMKFLI